MNILLYFALLALVSGYALVRGGREEKIAAAVCVAASLGSRAIFRGAGVSYDSLQPAIAVIDFGVLAAFIAIALRTKRFWPLWVAGLQLTATTGHMLKLLDPALVPFAYGAALASWSYPILLIIAIGTWRVGRERLRYQDMENRSSGTPSAA